MRFHQTEKWLFMSKSKSDRNRVSLGREYVMRFTTVQLMLIGSLSFPAYDPIHCLAASRTLKSWMAQQDPANCFAGSMSKRTFAISGARPLRL
jgi:hypothetical protein